MSEEDRERYLDILEEEPLILELITILQKFRKPFNRTLGLEVDDEKVFAKVIIRGTDEDEYDQLEPWSHR